MKKSFILILGSVLICIHSFSQTAEQEAIKKVCLGEVQAYTNLDYDNWASYHAQTADEQLAWNNPDGTYGFQSGWDTISKGIKDYFKTAQKENVKLSSDNFTFVIHNDMAFVSFSRSVQNEAGKTMQLREYRTLLRSKGKWKILAVQAYADHTSGK